MSDRTGSGSGAGVVALALNGATRSQLREEIARFFGYHAGTATGGSTETIIDTRLARWHDNYFVGANVWIVAARDGPENEDAMIFDFVRSTGTLSVAPAFSTTIVAGNEYHIFMQVTKEEIDHALNRSCWGEQAAYVLTPVADTLEYGLSHVTGLSATEQVTRVWVRLNDSPLQMPQELGGCRIDADRGELTLRLPFAMSEDDGLWIDYVLDENGEMDDATRVHLPVQLVKARALTQLIQNILPRQDAAGRDKWGQLLRYWDEQLVAWERKQQPRSGSAAGYAWRTPASGKTRAQMALGL